MPTTNTNEFGVAIPPAHSIDDFIDDQLRNTQVSLQFPEDRPKYYTTLDFATYTFRTGTRGTPQAIVGQQVDSSPTGGIVLPLPINLVDNHTVKYDEKPIAQWFSGIVNAFVPGSVGVARTLTGIIGLAPNAYQAIMFDRPEYKRHELAFKLAPRNFTESSQIRNIIQFINNAMAPDTSGLGSNLALLFEFPDIVQVTFRPNDGFLYKLKPCVIERFNINYNAGDKKAFYHDQGRGTGNNPPESIEFSILLIEIEYWIKRDFTISNS